MIPSVFVLLPMMPGNVVSIILQVDVVRIEEVYQVVEGARIVVGLLEHPMNILRADAFKRCEDQERAHDGCESRAFAADVSELMQHLGDCVAV